MPRLVDVEDALVHGSCRLANRTVLVSPSMLPSAENRCEQLVRFADEAQRRPGRIHADVDA